MITVIGVFTIIIGAICWIGQTLSLFFPKAAVKLGVLEPKEEMDETFYIIDAKVLGLNDLLLTWTLPVSAIMMLFQISYWPIIALMGSGVYLYFAGYIIFSRIILGKHSKKVGSRNSQNTGYIFGVLWIISSVAMSILAFKELYE